MVSKAPGHITGFFSVVFGKNLESTGSIGAGVCIEPGASVDLRVQQGVGSIKVVDNGVEVAGDITKRVISNILGDRLQMYDIEVVVEHSLPLSQGFGLSASIALSVANEIVKKFGMRKNPQDMLRYVHEAEVKLGGGMGDAVAEVFGSFVLREKAGLPPYGRVRVLNFEHDTVVATIVGPPILTATILGNSSVMDKINRVGAECVREFAHNPSIDNFFAQSWRFSTETGLACAKIRRVVDDVRKFGLASMCMLGNAVFAIGDEDKLRRTMEKFGEVHVLKVARKGADGYFSHNTLHPKP